MRSAAKFRVYCEDKYNRNRWQNEKNTVERVAETRFATLALEQRNHCRTQLNSAFLEEFHLMPLRAETENIPDDDG
jgi:hypothetical protein